MKSLSSQLQVQQVLKPFLCCLSMSIPFVCFPRSITVARDDGLYQVYTLDRCAAVLPGCSEPTDRHAHVRKLGGGALWGASTSRHTGEGLLFCLLGGGGLFWWSWDRWEKWGTCKYYPVIPSLLSYVIG
jgi:hypothetical protein